MSAVEVLMVFMVCAFLGVLAFGLSILRSIRQRSDPLKPVPPKPMTPFDKEVARSAAEFKQELADAYAEALRKDRRK